MIDMRSDTVSKPTAEMRRAMAEAEVGDDVYADDPSVLALERRTAEILGKEAACYMPTGTMTNQVAIRAHTEATGTTSAVVVGAGFIGLEMAENLVTRGLATTVVERLAQVTLLTEVAAGRPSLDAQTLRLLQERGPSSY